MKTEYVVKYSFIYKKCEYELQKNNSEVFVMDIFCHLLHLDFNGKWEWQK